MTDKTDKSDQLVRIIGVDEDETSMPRNDGTPGSALYDVPLKLNRIPSAGWADMFIQTWNRPPTRPMKHRPGIASVEGDRIWLHGTTIEEIEKHHLSTLKSCVEVANDQFNAALRSAKAATDTKCRRKDEHRQHVRKVIKRLKFD